VSRASLAAAKGELHQLRRQLRFMDSVRSSIASAGPRLRQLEPTVCALTLADIELFDHSFNRRSDHHLTYASGYAVLESYINDLIRATLRFLERSGSYGDLPSPTKRAMRQGTSRLLGRLNWRRFAHLSELEVARNYFESVSGEGLTFSDETIISADANYRADEIKDAFRRCGLGNVWQGVLSDASLSGFLASTILEDNTVPSILNMLVSRRNEVSHGTAKAIDSTDILVEITMFLDVLLDAVFRSLSRETLFLIKERGRLRSVGRIVERYRKQIGIVTVNPGETIKVSDLLLVERDGAFQARQIAALQIDDIPVFFCRGSQYLEVGVDFGQVIPKRGDVYQLTDPLDFDLI
jgi:hypothetical protein